MSSETFARAKGARAIQSSTLQLPMHKFRFVSCAGDQKRSTALILNSLVNETLRLYSGVRLGLLQSFLRYNAIVLVLYNTREIVAQCRVFGHETLAC